MHPFDYVRAHSVGDALAAHVGDARFLAGGQSLVQAMKLRLSAAQTLVDLGAVQSLRGVSWQDGQLVVGAMTSHAEVASHPLVRQHLPALAELAAGIADPMVRQMGTMGGSLANADPAACYPAAVLALQAQVHTDRRTVQADDFFVDLYQTALEPGELIESVSFAPCPQAAYAKFRQPASRFALVGVFVARCGDEVRVAVTGAMPRVFRCEALEQALMRDFSADAARAVRVNEAGLMSDLHGNAAYRAAMIPVMAARAVTAIRAR